MDEKIYICSSEPECPFKTQYSEVEIQSPTRPIAAILLIVATDSEQIYDHTVNSLVAFKVVNSEPKVIGLFCLLSGLFWLFCA